MSTSNTFEAARASRVGMRVLYMLNEDDARAIVIRRLNAGRATRSGNDPHEGQVYPGVIVADWFYPLESDAQRDPSDVEARRRNFSVNIQVFLDGEDSYWATSRSQYQLAPGEPLDEHAPNQRGHWVPDRRS